MFYQILTEKRPLPGGDQNHNLLIKRCDLYHWAKTTAQKMSVLSSKFFYTFWMRDFLQSEIALWQVTKFFRFETFFSLKKYLNAFSKELDNVIRSAPQITQILIWELSSRRIKNSSCCVFKMLQLFCDKIFSSCE